MLLRKLKSFAELREMAKEMVRQDFNRPSVMIWGYMNEIFCVALIPKASNWKITTALLKK